MLTPYTGISAIITEQQVLTTKDRIEKTSQSLTNFDTTRDYQTGFVLQIVLVGRLSGHLVITAQMWTFARKIRGFALLVQGGETCRNTLFSNFGSEGFGFNSGWVQHLRLEIEWVRAFQRVAQKH